MPGRRGCATRFSVGRQIRRCANGCLEPGAPILGAGLVRAVEHLTQSVHREEIQHLGWRANEGWLAAAAHADDLVTELRHVRQGVGHHDDGHSVIGQSAEQAHDLPVGALVQPTGHFVEQQQTGPVEYLAGQARAFLLPAAERTDALVEPIQQIDVPHRIVYRRAALLDGGVRWQSKPRRIIERLAQRELLVQDVLLRHECDILLQSRKIGVQVASVEQYRPLARERPAGHDVHQRGLARTVGTDDGDELGRANTQVGGVQDTLWRRTGPPARHVVADVAHQQLDIADAPAPGKRGPVEGQFEWADIDAVTWDQGTGATQPRTVDIGTIGAAEIAQHDGSVHYLERRVTARDIRMVEHDLPWHRLATDGQVVVERHAVRCDGTPIFVVFA